MSSTTGLITKITLYNACPVSCRPIRLLFNGVKFQKTDFVLVDWQEDDSPLFCSITDIVVVNCEYILFKVKHYRTCGIDYHYHSYLIEDC